MIYSHLEAVQLILSAMDSDEVNSISDTVESNQVSLLLKSVYYDIATEIGLPEHEDIFQLNASVDSTKPNVMYTPNNVVKVRKIYYDNREDVLTDPKNNVEVSLVKADEFIRIINGATDFYTETLSVPNSIDDPVELAYNNTAFPQYCTTFDDRTFIFDSFNASIDDTLKKSRTTCLGLIYPEYLLEDSFVPDLNPGQFSYFINKAKVRAFAELKQASNQEASSEARRQKIVLQKKKYSSPNKLNALSNLPYYGRK